MEKDFFLCYRNIDDFHLMSNFFLWEIISNYDKLIEADFYDASFCDIDCEINGKMILKRVVRWFCGNLWEVKGVLSRLIYSEFKYQKFTEFFEFWVLKIYWIFWILSTKNLLNFVKSLELKT